MLRRFVDHLLAVTKESVKTFTYESLINIARLINGVSALLLSLLPGKTNILEGIHDWELRPTLRGPRLPRWMENGVSSFNMLVHELSLDPETSLDSYSVTGEEDYDENICPTSPMSQASRLSNSSTVNRYDRRLIRLIKIFLAWTLWPVAIFLWFFKCFRRGGAAGNISVNQFASPRLTRRFLQTKDHVLQRTTDRRRGVIEDLHLAIEIFIESAFGIAHKAAHLLLSPSEVCRKVVALISSNGGAAIDNHDSNIDMVFPTATIGDTDPTPTERRRTLHYSLNTDARTCQDVITELGYPYEVVRVVTSDGYVLLLERIPRRDSGKVVYLQHGIFDTSMGWVSNGVVGSPAFAAFDQGYDVFLGNLRGLVSREHVDTNISSRKYWRYSINEHATKDIPAMIEKIHEIKTAELNELSKPDSDEVVRDQPYKLCAISHSLGGAVMLMYVITSRINLMPHRLSRLILLSPAGFHDDSTIVFTLIEKVMLLLGPVIAAIVPGLYIPTRFFRMLINKLARDFQNYPAVGGLVQTLISYVAGGDSSNWIGVLGLPHYNMYDMPGVSLYVALHLAQIKHSKKFIMFDHGSAAANMKAYGTPEPLDLGQHYNLIGIPVDLVAGRKDKVIRPSMVKRHYALMRKADVDVSYKVFEYAHLDFTFSHREELLAYVISRLLLVDPPQKQHRTKTTLRHRKPSGSQRKTEGSGTEHRAEEIVPEN
ncbi:uncharacterized protein LOC121986121 isoform X1 [Zingiber officinale]|uniref:uncharacterized protein LOC121986121 isoform X1 n=2 Tax=Zingiber officinale TaxID=94328 RepID=UPI001C4D7F4B|nr:uncharacterized protein LOC121986121 isoform X1 [Zingiber officinale]